LVLAHAILTHQCRMAALVASHSMSSPIIA
jgi:hypothetical protein